jgi:putative ABC transport system permease protein
VKRLRLPRVLGRLGVSVPAVASIALLASTAAVVLSTVAAIFWRPLPAPDADRLVTFELRSTRGAPTHQLFPYAVGAQWAETSRAFDAQSFLLEKKGRLEAGPALSEEVSALIVSGPFFQMLGARVSHGHLPLSGQVDGDVPVVIATEAARRLFGGAASAVGQRGLLSGIPNQIVGCLDVAFDEWHQPQDLFIPLGSAGALVSPVELTEPGYFGASGVARIRQGYTLQAAHSDVARLITYLDAASPGSNGQYGVEVRTMRQALQSRMNLSLLGFLVAVVCVAVIVVTGNVAHLLLADCHRRRREFMIRAFVGATHASLVRLLVGEGVVLGGVAAVAAGLLAVAGASILNGQVARLVGLSSLSTWRAAIIPGIVLFSVVPFVVVALLQGQVVRRYLQTFRGHRPWLRLVLIVGQVALATAAVLAAAALLTSTLRLARVDLGFDPTGVYAVKVRLPDDVDRKAVDRRLLQDSDLAVRSLGARAALASDLPLDGRSRRGSVWFEDGRTLRNGKEPQRCPILHAVSSGFFEVVGLKLAAGRSFDAADDAGRPSAIVNRRFAEAIWPGENPIGKRIRTNPRSDWHEIVGVVENARTSSVWEEAPPELYVPAWESLKIVVYVVSRSSRATTLVNMLRESVRWADPHPQAVGLEALQRAGLVPMRMTLILLAVSGVIVLILAGIGVYGTAAFLLQGHAKDWAIRLALGGPRWVVLGGLLRWLLVAVSCGTGVGLVAGAGLSAMLRAAMSGVGGVDLSVYLGVVGFLVAVMGIACAVASRSLWVTNPAASLRES